MIELNAIQYGQAVAEGRTTHPHGITSNRADTISVDGVVYSAEKFAQKHRYNWSMTSCSQTWCYMSESGEELLVIHRKGRR